MWTTNAQFASFGLLLARTDPDVPKHKGLTMFIVPMDAAGVTVRGLRQISGEAEFNEVFFDDVTARRGRRRRRRRQRLGHRADGADVRAADDRLRLGGLGLAGRARRRRSPATPPPARDPEVRARLGEVITELLAVRFNGYRALTALSRGQIPGPEAGLAKVTMVNARDRRRRPGRRRGRAGGARRRQRVGYLISFLPGLKSAGGTEQILRNTIGERVLGLPPEPRLDKGMPFSELRAKERRRWPMNFALSDEQVLLREAARGALVRVKTVEAAREALEDPARCPTCGRWRSRPAGPGC